MARIRTVKPEFFTSEDITELCPLARLLYIALWCEADREGRFEWKPKTFKIRYLPADDCDIESLCNEILSRRLVVVYDEQLAYIPSFQKHQHINPRESKSRLPEPRVSHASITRESRDPDAQVGKEGKGKERKGKEKKEPTVPKKTVFKAPEISEVLERCAEIGLEHSEGYKFHAYYSSKGWMVGKSKMVNWHQALTGWKLRASSNNGSVSRARLASEVPDAH